MHILGTTGEGKSRFIEHLIRGDIQQGNGLCFLDPSENGETAYAVLKYCAEIGFKKICLIDPHLHSISVINPFHTKHKDASVGNVTDTLRVLFNQTSDADTPRIRRYLPALLRCLINSGMTLADSLYFSDRENPFYVARRRLIFERLDDLDHSLIILEGVFKTQTRFENYFSSTVNRLDPFWHSKLSLMFGSAKGIDFTKLITEGWVILVNLYPGLGFEPIHTRLLGTSIINELIFSIDLLRNQGWRGVYYLYIDEAGRYANRNLAELLNKRKSGLRVTIAHQYFSQFEDKVVLDAVKQMPKIKVMFNTPNYYDRLEMIKLLGYGGDITHGMAQYANQDLPKQYAIVKSGKQPPTRIKIEEVKDTPWKVNDKREFIKTIQHPWTYSEDDIKQQIHERFKEARTTSPRARKNANRPTTGKPSVWDVQRNDSPPTADESGQASKANKN